MEFSEIGYTKVNREFIHKALDGYQSWNEHWWDKLQEYRQTRIDQFDSKLWVKLSKLVGCKYEDNYKVNNFGGTFFCFEYYAVQGIVPQEDQHEFYEYYAAQLKDTAKKLKSMIVVSDADPYVSAEGCKFIRRFGGFE